MRHGSLFSGIGGFDLAAEWMGWDNVFHCEWNPFGQKILKHYWPNAISYTDITKTDFSIHRRNIDIITGGFPCQPFSTAGKRKGTKDNRYLWPEMLRAIREIQPSWVVGENVRGIVNWSEGLVFDKVQTDLEVAGYEVAPFLLPACSVDAPHRRDRIWFIAYSERSGTNGDNEIESGKGREYALNDSQSVSVVADTDSLIRFKRFTKKQISWKSNLQGFEFKRGFEDFSRRWRSPSPRTCGVNDGIPNRVDRIKALGNAIVPQVAFEIFKAIESYELSNPNKSTSL